MGCAYAEPGDFNDELHGRAKSYSKD
ncbi:uncharacterized protein G2W53_039825 [Senna tora]|uniref:Uncharacterized protein n=1 Tax=Senna tora TaxID=362788 RepID=A0A834W8B3_9FABA|nr:uncharacterized protein G2W53_039825 [Senna tora]